MMRPRLFNSRLRLCWVLVSLFLVSCATVPPAPPSIITGRDPEFIQTCKTIWLTELGRDIDPPAAANCLDAARHFKTGEDITAGVRASEEYRLYQEQRRLPNGGESGWLEVRGRRLLTAAGTWRSRGFSDFKLFQKFLDGEDLDGLLTERIQVGANELRVFGMFNGGIGRFLPVTYGDGYWVGLDAFLNKLASRGLRVEFVVFADAQNILVDIPSQLAHLERIAAILTTHWNTRGELVNEWPQNGVDPTMFENPPGLTLWSRGSNLGDQPPFYPHWDFITDHPGRNSEWPRKVEARPISDAFGVPASEDEPMGAAEADQPGRRSASVEDFSYLGGLCSLWATGGCTFHSDAGILSVPLGPVQKAAARAFFSALTFAPSDAPLWRYQRGDAGSQDGVGLMPLYHLDSLALRTACRPNPAETEEWCAVVRPAASWQAIPRNDWRVNWQGGAKGTLIHLVKP